MEIKDVQILTKENIAEHILPRLKGDIHWKTGYLNVHTAVLQDNKWIVNGYSLADILNNINDSYGSYSYDIAMCCKNHLQWWYIK